MAAAAAVQPTLIHSAESVLFLVLLQLTIITFAGRLGGVLAQRFRQAAVTGEIVVGILLVRCSSATRHQCFLPADFLYLHRSAHPHWRARYLGTLGLVSALSFSRDTWKIRCHLSSCAQLRYGRKRILGTWCDDEHPWAGGVDRSGHWLGFGRDFTPCIHHARHHGHHQHPDHGTRPSPVRVTGFRASCLAPGAFLRRSFL